jgi:hypothetical protein
LTNAEDGRYTADTVVLLNWLSQTRATPLRSGSFGRAPTAQPSPVRLILVALLLVAAPLVAQGDHHITTGAAAASAFVHQGRPIHPLCVLFAQEKASRSRANEFANCSDTSVVPDVSDGWTTARLSERRGYSSYRVLAHEGDRFLLALESSGGGSGEFSDLSWVQVGSATIRNVKDILGGDRCAGGLSGYHVDGRTVRLSAALSTVDILRLAGVRVADTVLAKLSSGYLACNGYANYEYDLATDSLVLTSVTLAADGSTTVRTDAASLRRDPQSCFDALAQHALVARKATLGLPELRTFGARFVRECIR